VPIEAGDGIGGKPRVVPTRDGLTLEDVHEHRSPERATGRPSAFAA
jgi:hypothetical protein